MAPLDNSSLYLTEMYDIEKVLEEISVESVKDDEQDCMLEETSLLDLPVEIVQHIISFLTLKG